MFARLATVCAFALTLSNSAHATHTYEPSHCHRSNIKDCEPDIRMPCPKSPPWCDPWLGVPPEMGGCPEVSWRCHDGYLLD